MNIKKIPHTGESTCADSSTDTIRRTFTGIPCTDNHSYGTNTQTHTNGHRKI